jgi:hypothetical protein
MKYSFAVWTAIEARSDFLARALAQGFALIGIIEKFRDCARPGARIFRGNEDPVCPVVYVLRRAADARRHDCRFHRHPFDQASPERLLPRGSDQHIKRPHDRRDIGALAPELDAMSQAELRDQLPQAIKVGEIVETNRPAYKFRLSNQDQTRPRMATVEQTKSLDCEILTLPRRDLSH